MDALVAGLAFKRPYANSGIEVTVHTPEQVLIRVNTCLGPEASVNIPTLHLGSTRRSTWGRRAAPLGVDAPLHLSKLGVNTLAEVLTLYEQLLSEVLIQVTASGSGVNTGCMNTV